MEQTLFSKNWFKLGILNLLLVALYGATMRYKIAFSFPFFDQKNLLHAHSHFAFNGWVSHMIYCGLVYLIYPFLKEGNKAKYTWIIIANLLASFGMLIAFTAQGYKPLSITFSGLTIVVGIIFAIAFIRDGNRYLSNHPSLPWAKAGLLLNILSAGGPLMLGYTMASGKVNPEIYLGSVYYYLHFQYSGWFLFGSIALIVAVLPEGFPSLKKYFWPFALTAIPTFFLSILWVKLPLWIYIITVIAILIQFSTWVAMLAKFLPLFNKIKTEPSKKWITMLLYAAGLAASIKFLLQAISVVPSLSQLVFGFRPIVIGYLHLVLLGVYSLFLLGYGFKYGWLRVSKWGKFATLMFFVGVLLNETVLAVQGTASFTYTPIPYINEMLLVAAIMLFGSAFLLFFNQIIKSQTNE